MWQLVNGMPVSSSSPSCAWPLQCAGVAKAEPSGPDTLAWTCGLSSGAITGLVTALDGVDGAAGPVAPAPPPQGSGGMLFEFSFFRPLLEPTGVTGACQSAVVSLHQFSPGTGIGYAASDS